MRRRRRRGPGETDKGSKKKKNKNKINRHVRGEEKYTLLAFCSSVHIVPRGACVCYLHVVDDSLEQSAQRSALLLHRLHGVHAHANEESRRTPGRGGSSGRISDGIRSTDSWTSDGGDKSRSSALFVASVQARGVWRRWRAAREDAQLSHSRKKRKI